MKRDLEVKVRWLKKQASEGAEAIHVNILALARSRSTPKHGEKSSASSNFQFGKLPPGGDAIPAPREYQHYKQEDFAFAYVQSTPECVQNETRLKWLRKSYLKKKS